MKEATGEFSMTVITIIAVAVIAGLIAWLGPRIAGYVQDQWGILSGSTTEDCGDGKYWNGSKCENVVTQTPKE